MKVALYVDFLGGLYLFLGHLCSLGFSEFQDIPFLFTCVDRKADVSCEIALFLAIL